jgi:hypothetical protein
MLNLISHEYREYREYQEFDKVGSKSLFVYQMAFTCCAIYFSLRIGWGKIDLKDAYFVIPVWKHHRKYLRFIWKGTLLEFACLPFGLATAPRLFTKIMEPVVALLRRARLRLIIYLDDHLFMNQSKEGLKLDMATAQYLLENLGSVINLEKSHFIPTQQSGGEGGCLAELPCQNQLCRAACSASANTIHH